MRKKLKKAVPIVILGLLPFALFYKAALGSSIITSGDFSWSDLLDLHFPFKAILHRTLPKGLLPLWEPNVSLGFPILAEGQSGPLYPLNIITSFLPPELDLNLSIIITFIFLIYYIFEAGLAIARANAASTLPLAFIGFSLITATAVGLSAVQLLPTLELSQFSQ